MGSDWTQSQFSFPLQGEQQYDDEAKTKNEDKDYTAIERSVERNRGDQLLKVYLT